MRKLDLPDPEQGGHAREQFTLCRPDRAFCQCQVELDLQERVQELWLAAAIAPQPLDLHLHRVVGPFAGVEQPDSKPHPGVVETHPPHDAARGIDLQLGYPPVNLGKVPHDDEGGFEEDPLSVGG